MDFRNILFEKKDHIARITLNRPETMNALNEEMFDELAVAIAALAEDDDSRVVVLTGAGRAFSAGGDLRKEGGRRCCANSTPKRSAAMCAGYRVAASKGYSSFPSPPSR